MRVKSSRRVCARTVPPRARWAVGVAAFALLASAATAQAPRNAERGASRAATCGACHGADGNSTLVGTPSLAGQPATFLTLQLILFREGLRQVPAMQGLVADFSERDIEDVSAHYARLPVTPAKVAVNAPLAKSGQQLAHDMACGSCHLPDYSGRDQMPRLAGQREDYLNATMIAYRENKRSGSDTTMNGVMHGVSDAQIAALAHYFAQLR